MFWCFDGSGSLRAVVAEVHNTYGERHAYLLQPDAAGIAHVDKAFHVSPFFDESGSYELRFTLTADTRRHDRAAAARGALGVQRDVPRPAATREPRGGGDAESSGNR